MSIFEEYGAFKYSVKQHFGKPEKVTVVEKWSQSIQANISFYLYTKCYFVDIH